MKWLIRYSLLWALLSGCSFLGVDCGAEAEVEKERKVCR